MGETQWEDDAGKRGQVDTTFSAQVDILFLAQVDTPFSAQVDALIFFSLG